MKTLKFRNNLVPQILNGRYNTTWRVYDEKNLQVGDEFEMINWDTRQKFGEGVITAIKEKRLGEIDEPDYLGHARFNDPGEMLTHYRELYGQSVTMETPVKVVTFTVKQQPPPAE